MAAIVIFFLPLGVFAQARQSATRAAGIDVFGALSDTDTAYYGTDRHLGATAGIDFTEFRYFPSLHGRLTPSLELRATDAPGNLVSEQTIQGGVKVAYNHRSLHPYVDVLVGGGNVTFHPPNANLEAGYVYASDSSFLFNYGGGIMVDLLPRWSIIADYEHQSWNLGFTPEVKFTPQSVSLGVVYHLRLKPFR